MFGINNVSQVQDIAQGWANDVLNREQELYNKRMPICKKCPLYTNDSVFHGKCDANKFYNPSTKEIATLPGEGFVSGCGCKLSAKVRVARSICPLKKW